MCFEYIIKFFSLQNAASKTSECDLECTTVKLLNSIEATRVTYAKVEKRRKETDPEYEKLRKLLTYEDVSYKCYIHIYYICYI